MTEFLKGLEEAAARGVAVTIVTSHREPPPITLKWIPEEKWWGASATYRAAGYDLYVADCDGDRSVWSLTRGKSVIASGESHAHLPYYHFDLCILFAEAALRAEVARRKAELSGADR